MTLSRFFAFLTLLTALFWGENTMADSLNKKQEAFALEASTAARGDQKNLQSPDKTGAQNVLFGFGTENTAYAKYFIGKSYLQPLTSGEIAAANVTFEPKCRNNWHIHHKAGQTLLVVAGRGYYQEWGKAPQMLKPGDAVEIRPEVKHWHGAAKDSWFTHIALSAPKEGASTEWLEPVSDAEYDKLD
jgi:quercetin dioxygenase-like cupin family protein